MSAKIPINMIKQNAHVNSRSREEAKLDADIDDLLEPKAVNDSIMDSEDEEESDEEDEVNSILASDEDEP